MKTVISQCEHWTDNLAEFEETESLHRPVQYKINDDNGALKVAETSALV